MRSGKPSTLSCSVSPLGIGGASLLGSFGLADVAGHAFDSWQAPTYMLTATSMGELENKIHSQLPLDLVDAAGSLGARCSLATDRCLAFLHPSASQHHASNAPMSIHAASAWRAIQHDHYLHRH